MTNEANPSTPCVVCGAVPGTVMKLPSGCEPMDPDDPPRHRTVVMPHGWLIASNRRELDARGAFAPVLPERPRPGDDLVAVEVPEGASVCTDHCCIRIAEYPERHWGGWPSVRDTVGQYSRIAKEFVDVIDMLVAAGRAPSRADGWFVPSLHDQRHRLWSELTPEERQHARDMLGDRASWI